MSRGIGIQSSTGPFKKSDPDSKALETPKPLLASTPSSSPRILNFLLLGLLTCLPSCATRIKDLTGGKSEPQAPQTASENPGSSPEITELTREVIRQQIRFLPVENDLSRFSTLRRSLTGSALNDFDITNFHNISFRGPFDFRGGFNRFRLFDSRLELETSDLTTNNLEIEALPSVNFPDFEVNDSITEFPPPTPVERKLEIIPDNYREIAEADFNKIEIELNRTSERIYRNFYGVQQDVYMKAGIFKRAIPEMLQDLEVKDFTSLLRWMRLYKLLNMLGGEPSLELKNQTRAYLRDFSLRVIDSYWMGETATTEVLVDSIVEGVNYRAKELAALHELADPDDKPILIQGLTRLEEHYIRRIGAKNIKGHLERLVSDISQTVGFNQKRITLADANRYAGLKIETPRDYRVINNRDPGLRAIGQVIEIDRNFINVAESEDQTSDQTGLFYDYTYKGEKVRFAVEVFEPRSIEGSPLFILRDINNAERFIIINTQFLLESGWGDMNIFALRYAATARARGVKLPKNNRRSGIPKFVNQMLIDYERERDPEIIKEFAKLDLNDYEHIVLIRLNSAEFDPFSSANLTERMLERIGIEETVGKDKVTVSPFIFTFNPVKDLIEEINKYKQQFAGKRVLFIPHIPAHGNLSTSLLGGTLDPNYLITELDRLEIEAYLLLTPCSQGGFGNACSLRIAKSELPKSNLHFFLTCAEGGFAITSIRPKAHRFEYINSSSRSPAYDIFRLLELLKGRTWGEAHINADRAVKALEKSNTDAQVYSSSKKLGLSLPLKSNAEETVIRKILNALKSEELDLA